MHSLSTKEDAERVITAYIRYYNEERLISVIEYIAPADRLAGRHEAIHAIFDITLLTLHRELRHETRDISHSYMQMKAVPEVLHSS
jgi:hypothetical protein